MAATRTPGITTDSKGNYFIDKAGRVARLVRARAMLVLVDILGRRILRWKPADQGLVSWDMPSKVGSIGLRARSGLIVALRRGFHLLDTETGTLMPQRLVRAEVDSEHREREKPSDHAPVWIELK